MSNANKAKLLGMPFGTAQGKLRKALLFKFVQRAGEANCYRCGDWIFDIDVFTVEHKKPWGSAKDPVRAFFDLDNVAFSHIKCNSGAVNRGKTHCPQDHEYTEEMREKDGSRSCRKCRQKRQKRWYHSPENRQKRKAYPSRRSVAGVTEA